MGTWARRVEVGHAATMAALVVVVGVDPTSGMRRADDWAGWLTGQQRLDRVMSRVAPPLFLTTTALGAAATAVAISRRQTSSAVGRAAATGLTAAAVAVTLAVNEPLNARLRGWRSSDTPPEDWRTVRAGWDRGHRYRRGLVAAAGVASLWGLLASRRPVTTE